MRCTKCGYPTIVLDSRETLKENTVRRRRKCISCEHKFTTYEHIEKRENKGEIIKKIIEFLQERAEE